MKIEQISPHIWSLKSWLVVPIHVWIVQSNDGLTLVDAGVSPMAKGISKFTDGLNAGPLRQILLTHGHGDHVGAIPKILSNSAIPVYAHAIEIPYMEGRLVYPRRKKAQRSLQPGIAQPLPTGDDGLEPLAGLTPYHTPGHAPGHVVYYHEEDGVLLAGDMCTSKGGRLYRPMPMFTADMAEALRSSEIVRRLQPKRLEVCHGESVFNPAEHLEDYISTTAAKFAISLTGATEQGIHDA